MLKSGHRLHSRTLLLTGLLVAGPAWAQGAHGLGEPAPPPPATLTLAQQAARRFPQPVRVGDLYDRQVLEPSNHQGVLGRVDEVVRTGDGQLELVMRYGGVLGLDTRKIAIPIDAMTLLGPFMQVVGVPVPDLSKLPTFDPATAQKLAADDVIRVGINRN